MLWPDGLVLMEARILRVTFPGVRRTYGPTESRKTDLPFVGLFAGTIGVRRLLKLFDKYKIKTTFFIPGHSLETFPEECAMIRDAGHEMFARMSYAIRSLLTLTAVVSMAILTRIRFP